MQITFKNVQSVKDATISLNPGEYVSLYGASNSGKTALFRGLEDLLLNVREAKNDINFDAADNNQPLEVTLIDDNDNEFKYTRTASSASYTINGEQFSKLGRSNLFDVSKVKPAGFCYMPNDPTRKLFNLHNENNHLFPFDRSGGEMFKFFETLFGLTSTTDVLRVLNLDLSGLDGQIKDNRTFIDSSKSKIEEYSTFINSVNLEDLQLIQKNLDSHNNIINSINQDMTLVVNLSSYVSAVNTVVAPELVLTDYSGLLNLTKDLEDSIKLAAYIVSVRQLKDVQEPTDLAITSIIDDCSLAASLQTAIENTHQTVLTIEQSLAVLLDELKDVETCPLCNQVVKGGLTC